MAAKHLVKLTHPQHGLLEGFVDAEMFERLQANDSEAVDQFIQAFNIKADSQGNTDENMEKAVGAAKSNSESKWSQKKEDALLQAYHDVTHNDNNGKSRLWSWSKVAGRFEELYEEKLTAEVARLKIRSLRDKYRRLEDHNNRTGNDPVEIPELMLTAFGTENAIKVKTLENTPKVEGTSDQGEHQDQDDEGSSRKRLKKVTERQTGAQVVMQEMRLLREEDRKIQSEQFKIKCDLAQQLISAIKSQQKDEN